MTFSENEQRIADEAFEYAKRERTKIARDFTDPETYIPEADPVSVFMAGSPGAGKTEASKELLKLKASDGSPPILRIDPDELRSLCPGYEGNNSALFQSAVIKIVERIHDLALKQSQSFLLDGTLSHHEVARRNIMRSLKKRRTVQILYVYQEPSQAWNFVKAREHEEGRQISIETFVNQYFAARNVVNQLKNELGKRIQVDLLMKNNDGSSRFYEANVNRIENFIPEKYDSKTIWQVLE